VRLKGRPPLPHNLEEDCFVLRLIALAVASLLTGSGFMSLGADLTFGKEVTVVEDGAASQITLLGGSVAEVLIRLGVTLESRDEVSPALTTRVEDGSVITVRHARLVTLTVDGVAGLYWTTATTVDALIAELDFDPETIQVATEGETDIPRSGLGLSIARGSDVAVTADGATSTVHAFGAVADALKAAGLAWDEDDLVSPGLATSLADAPAVTLTRVEAATVQRDVETPYTTVYEDADSLYQGQTQVKTPGQVGIVRQVVRQTFHDGQLAAEEVLSEETISQPVTQTTLRGTKERPAGAAPEGVWAALAQCESGGRANINTGNGYYGLYQFTLGTWRSLGGTGLPSEASAEEQTRIAQILQARSGWGQWPGCARRLGLL
jgi:uncharacterized protein YabE (DUF348 family)